MDPGSQVVFIDANAKHRAGREEAGDGRGQERRACPAGHPTDATRVQSQVDRVTRWYDAGLESGYLFYLSIELAGTFEPTTVVAPGVTPGWISS